MAPYVVYRDPGQWIGSKLWYWKKQDAPDGEGHGPYPFRWLATLFAKRGTGGA